MGGGGRGMRVVRNGGSRRRRRLGSAAVVEIADRVQFIPPRVTQQTSFFTQPSPTNSNRTQPNRTQPNPPTDQEMAELFARASNEAKSAFGDGSMFVEKYVEEPRHIEIQVGWWVRGWVGFGAGGAGALM